MCTATLNIGEQGMGAQRPLIGHTTSKGLGCGGRFSGVPGPNPRSVWEGGSGGLQRSGADPRLPSHVLHSPVQNLVCAKPAPNSGSLKSAALTPFGLGLTWKLVTEGGLA